MNLTEEDIVVLRDRLSREKAIELIPISLYVVILMVIGLIGNVLVCVFYCRKGRVTPTSRLIVAVAVIDTIICILMPKNIADISLSYKFTSSALCKLNNFVNHTSAVSSVMVLVAIASFRFRAVCKPFGRQFSVRHANISIVIAVVFSVLVSVPVLITHESVSINITVTPGNYIEGYDCNTSKKPSLKGLNLGVNVLHFFILVSTTVTFVALYGKMGYNILKYYKTKKVLTGKPSPRIKALRSDVYTDSSDSHMQETTTDVMSDHDKDMETYVTEVDQGHIDIKVPITDQQHKVPENEKDTTFNEAIPNNGTCYLDTNNQEMDNLGNREKRTMGISVQDEIPKSDKEGTKPANDKTDENLNLSSVAVKQTVMLCIITIIFVCSFLPYIIMNLSRTLSKNKDGDADFTNWIQFCTRSYLINSAANPFVYGLFNTEFRHFAKQILCRCFRR